MTPTTVLFRIISTCFNFHDQGVLYIKHVRAHCLLSVISCAKFLIGLFLTGCYAVLQSTRASSRCYQLWASRYVLVLDLQIAGLHVWATFNNNVHVQCNHYHNVRICKKICLLHVNILCKSETENVFINLYAIVYISVDVWSVGCIFAELLSRKILFQAQSPVQQVQTDLDYFTLIFHFFCSYTVVTFCENFVQMYNYWLLIEKIPPWIPITLTFPF